MTEVNGLRLAYRGFVTGLAGGYVWVAIGMVFGALAADDPLVLLRPVAMALTPMGDAPALAFVLGFAAVQLAGALIGMLFAYFFARFFTVRATLALAAPAVALLAWALIAAAFTRAGAGSAYVQHAGPVLATLAYGLLLAAGVPVRGEVTRYPGSPST